MVQIDPSARPEASSAAPATARAADKRAEILRRAAAVFREKGFHGAGMREIAAGLGMAPGALYYYFRSKDDLLYACQSIALKRLIEAADAAVAAPGPVAERLRGLVRAHLDQTLSELGGSAAHIEFHALPEDRLTEIVAQRDRYEGLLQALIAEGMTDGTFRACDPKLTTLSLLGALNWTVVWWRPEGRWTTDDLVDGLLGPFLLGLMRRADAPPEGSA